MPPPMTISSVASSTLNAAPTFNSPALLGEPMSRAKPNTAAEVMLFLIMVIVPLVLYDSIFEHPDFDVAEFDLGRFDLQRDPPLCDRR